MRKRKPQFSPFLVVFSSPILSSFLEPPIIHLDFCRTGPILGKPFVVKMRIVTMPRHSGGQKTLLAYPTRDGKIEVVWVLADSVTPKQQCYPKTTVLPQNNSVTPRQQLPQDNKRGVVSPGRCCRKTAPFVIGIAPGKRHRHRCYRSPRRAFVDTNRALCVYRCGFRAICALIPNSPLVVAASHISVWLNPRRRLVDETGTKFSCPRR